MNTNTSAVRPAVFAVALSFLLLSLNAARASVVAGFDLLATDPGATANLSFIDPSLSSVGLEGLPIGPGNTDTIIQRLGPPVPGLNNPGDSGLVPIELVALSLRSVAPVSLGGNLWDVQIESGSILGLPPNPTGSMQVFLGFGQGGSYDLDYDFQVRVQLTQVANPFITQTFFDNDQALVIDGGWIDQPGPDDQHGGPFPAGGLYMGFNSGALGINEDPNQIFGSILTLSNRAATPEPSRALLALLGLGISLLRRRRERR